MQDNAPSHCSFETRLNLLQCNMKPKYPNADIDPDAATDTATNADILRMRV
jgi:hypothetical protein